MSASNAAAEPSMEEILSSIRQAINEDIPGAVPENAGDPFASGSSAEAAFSSPPPGQAFDATVHESHDPFAELTRKLNETRESVQKQMHGVSSNLKSDDAEEAPADAQPAPPPSAQEESKAPETPIAAAPAPVTEEAEPVRAATFSAEPSEPAQAETQEEPVGSGALQALTARVADEQKAAVEPPKAAPAPEIVRAPSVQKPSDSQPPASSSEPAPKPQMPELSWASAERSAPTPPTAVEKPRPSAPEAPVATAAAPAAAVKPKVEVDPFPKLTAIVERGASQDTGSAKTDQAMVDLVLRRILEPAVKSWLDDNLPKIVTEVVREEVRRVANQTN